MMLFGRLSAACALSAIWVACVLNPQPLPPGETDRTGSVNPNQKNDPNDSDASLTGTPPKTTDAGAGAAPGAGETGSGTSVSADASTDAPSDSSEDNSPDAGNPADSDIGDSSLDAADTAVEDAGTEDVVAID